uniref:Uncharacterized protein n=1 Tax=viral metagenome TaxID=1070528 RepID=A0A6M3LLE5_9ZZZZ
MVNKDHECGIWDGLAEFQLKNCQGCKYVEAKYVGTGTPCCTKRGILDHQKGICYSKNKSLA